MKAKIFLTLFFLCTVFSSGAQTFKTFRDIPGITAEETAAIEALQARGTPLIYAASRTTELFERLDGTLGGYTVLFCDWLSELFGITFQPEIQGLSSMLANLKSGDINFATLSDTPERREHYFVTDPIAQRSLIILRADNSLPMNKITQERLPRYVFTQGSVMIDIVSAVLGDNSFEAIIVPNEESSYNALINGEADAFIATSNMEAGFDHLGGIHVEDFLPLVFMSAVMVAEKPEYEPIISLVTKAMENGAEKYLAELYRKGYESYRRHKFQLQLTEEEKAYIRDNPVIPFGTQYMTYPITFYNTQEKKWEGIAIDIIEELKTITGLDFKITHEPVLSTPQVTQLLENNEIFFMPLFFWTPNREDAFIWSNVSYMSDRYALLSKRDFPNVTLNDIPFQKVGLPRGTNFSEMFWLWFPNALYVTEYSNTDETFAALDRGEVDLVMTFQSRLSALTNFYELSDYKANYLFNPPVENYFGFNIEQTVLHSIIDKALPLINTQRIAEQWLTRTYNLEAMRLRQQRPYLIGGIISSLVVLSLVLITLVIINKKRKEEKLLRHTLDRREELLRVLNEAAIIFLSHNDDNYDDMINKGITLIANVLDLDRITIYRSFANPEKQTVSQIYRWIKELGGATALNKKLQDVPIEMFSPRWKEVISTSSPINGTVNTLPEEAPILKEFGILSLFSIPIYTDKKFWGFINFEDHKRERVFDDTAAEILRSAAFLCVNTIRNYEANKRYIEQSIQLVVAEKDKEIEKLTQIILDTAPFGASLWDSNYNVININNEFLRYFDVSSKQELIDNFFNTIPKYQSNGELSQDVIKATLKKAFDEGFNESEFEHIDQKGEKVPCKITLIRIEFNGKYLVIAYSFDLREQRAYFAEIENARKATEEASRAKSAFLANMSHEIRTPMNSIIGFTELAQSDDISAKTRRYLDKILESSEMLLSIINDILDISKIESGRMELENTSFYLEDIFNYCRTVIIPRIKQKDIELHCYNEVPEETKLEGDPIKLRQVLLNILSNAVKFTDIGTINIMASIIDSNDENMTIHFEIKDTGIGMNKKQIEKALEPFTQADTSITRKYGGTGLGLNITKNIIEMMGGKLEVESVLGLGSKFSFNIKFNLSSENAETPVYNMNKIEPEKPAFKGEVLICEDNKMNQQVIGEHLERVGLKYVIAENGQEGIDIIKNKSFDLVLMDIYMPVMDGMEAASKIIEMGITTPIVAMTANIMSNDIELYKKSGIVDFLGKPFTSQELWRCLMKYLPYKE